MNTHDKQHTSDTNNSHYKRMALMIVLSFISMYLLMYSMVDQLTNVIFNINQFYMASLMVSPMIFIEITFMNTMYKNKKVNVFIVLFSVVVFVISFLGIRQQALVTEKQFLKSMIPHHAAAILMVQKTEIKDAEIQKLANDIISSQQKEIEFMKSKLKMMKSN